MASTERGEKRSIDHLESEEAHEDDCEEVFGTILWGELCRRNLVSGIVEQKETFEGGWRFYIYGFDTDGCVKWADAPSWRSYADLWRATKQHPGEPVRTKFDPVTGKSWPTKEEMDRRVDIFARRALDEQKKQNLSRTMPVLGYNSMVVSSSSHQNPFFDFYDSLAHVARQRSMQEMHALRTQNERLTKEIQDLISKVEEQKQIRRRAVKWAKSALDKIHEENQKLRKNNEAMCDLKRDFVILEEEKKQLESKYSSLQKKVDGMASILRDD